jgi:polar amino acid transport system substrate-binding protein
MRTIRAALAGLLGVSTLCAITMTSAVAANASSSSSLSSCAKKIASQEVTKGTLTVATDQPAYTPWFENNTPSNGKGYESALVYALAKVLNVSKGNVKWVSEPFDASFAPGHKSFDFDINEISYTTARANVVTFSNGYYDVQQSIIALKTNKIVKDHSSAQLKTYQYGDQIGTTGLSYIDKYIKPTRPVRVYPTLGDATAALVSGAIDAIVIDTPDGQYDATSGITNSKNKLIATQVGQFPSTGEHYGMLLQKGDPLVGCINTALATLTSNGTVASLQKKWLNIYSSVPTIKP